MRARVLSLIMVALSFCVGLRLAAQSFETPVSLGVFVGAGLPQGNTASLPNADGVLSFNWGFYVNIPLIHTFTLTPSSELYRLGSQNATDFDIGFKFIVPLDSLSIYAGFAPGLTAASTVIDPHVGLLAGVGMKLVSNLDGFAQVKYAFIFDGSENIKVLHLNAGLIFNF